MAEAALLQGLHHSGAGAVPKDGPSAGIAIATALASLLSGRPVVDGLAMTGEITLRGRVLPIGGLKEKALAADREGLKLILFPDGNVKDLEEIAALIRRQIGECCAAWKARTVPCGLGRERNTGLGRSPHQ